MFFCFTGGSPLTMNAYCVLLEVVNASTNILDKYYVSYKTATPQRSCYYFLNYMTVVKGKLIVEHQLDISVN